MKRTRCCADFGKPLILFVLVCFLCTVFSVYANFRLLPRGKRCYVEGSHIAAERNNNINAMFVNTEVILRYDNLSKLLHHDPDNFTHEQKILGNTSTPADNSKELTSFTNVTAAFNASLVKSNSSKVSDKVSKAGVHAVVVKKAPINNNNKNTVKSKPKPKPKPKKKSRIVYVKKKIVRKRKPTVNQANLQQDLKDTVSKLQNWNRNISATMAIRNKLNRHLNKTDFICTQENTHIGTKYYDTMSHKFILINQSHLQLLPKTSAFSSKTAFKTCAIVGNGGILRNSGCGDEIDRFDFVMRSNLQPIRGFTADAGSKASFTSISQSLMTRYRVYKNEKYVRNFTNLNTTKLLKDLEEYKGYLLWIPNSKVSNLAFQVAELLKERTSLKVLLFNAEHSHKIQSFWGLTKRGLSTGMTLLSIGFSLCEEIHLYGFWPFPINYEGNPLPMHYTDDIAWSTYNKYHDYPAEFSLLTGLHRQGLLKIHTGKCH
ncbi:CMP-N-acetylneuraminate-poly-alpha-2,8-sialyltransferase-like [Saccoglossus kowalevskii]|uniref:Alpha-2,8-sialyltransferase 8F-like n=1 Tax=Saccoglossus kowalevskii TaxID=10224 RepID=A0ABM0GKT9_SACKO|nr:PREDICTED: alpha-2,8-sialyltransferase 8F-like [Saccoglossus kowalevskii]